MAYFFPARSAGQAGRGRTKRTPGDHALPVAPLNRPLCHAAQGMFMDVFRLGLKHGFNLPSMGEHALLNNGFRMFLASGEGFVLRPGWVDG